MDSLLVSPLTQRDDHGQWIFVSEGRADENRDDTAAFTELQNALVMGFIDLMVITGALGTNFNPLSRPDTSAATWGLSEWLRDLMTFWKRARRESGRMLGKAEAIGATDLAPVEENVWSNEAVATAAIEGEVLNLASVRSSVARRLGIAADLKATVPAGDVTAAAAPVPRNVWIGSIEVERVPRTAFCALA